MFARIDKNSRSDGRRVRSADVRKRYTTKPANVTMKMEPDLLRRVDAEVILQSTKAGQLLSRSDVMKTLLEEALAARARKRK